ncbi:MAG: SIS domain-containing protein, partial [Spirochaetes bacterium]|nr:SIS domain-containing protein [Spirochaetota bacterium]
MRIGDHMDRVLEEIALTLVDLTDREPELLLDMMQRAEKIFCAGSGRSGLVMRTFAMRLMHMSLQSFVAGETTTPGIGKRDLLIIGSGSGETEGLLVMAQRARQVGAQVALVT